MAISLRLATMADVPALTALIQASARALSAGYYTPAEAEAAIRYVFGVDTQLVADRTYFVAEDGTVAVGCGGWSKRRTLYGGDQRKMGAPELLDPRMEAARIRAFFVAPGQARRGVGAQILAACADAARAAGFSDFELMSTLPGVPFYTRLGFHEVEPVSDTLPDGTAIAFVRMRRVVSLAASGDRIRPASMPMEPLAPIYTADLFPGLHDELLQLLRGLSPEDWARPTIAGRWRVRDVVAHLLDGDLRKLSFGRDGHALIGPPPSSFDDVVALIDGLNASGVSYCERLTPRLLVDLLAITGSWVSTFVAERPPHEQARFSVAWAGEQQSEHWMDTGREYTERWHHQMQIRDAVGAPLLLERRWLYPLLDLSVRALPRAYAAVAAADGTVVTFEVEGDDACAWSLVREESTWRVMRGRSDKPSAFLSTNADTAWRLFFHALSEDAARSLVSIGGTKALAEPMLGARAVMVRVGDGERGAATRGDSESM